VPEDNGIELLDVEAPLYCLKNIRLASPRNDGKHAKAPMRTQPIIINSTKEKTTKPTQQLHLLIMEDNQLTKAGCIISTADNGVRALEHIPRTRFCTDSGIPLSIVLIDCNMPEMDGLTCCSKRREMEQRRQVLGYVPIIAVIANIHGGQIEEAKASGMDDVIGKPFRIPDLLDKMRELLRRLEGEEGRKVRFCWFFFKRLCSWFSCFIGISPTARRG
jgi:CheY-like chemotaxis protein